MKFKVCMVGQFSVGKTSLVSQYVSSVFSESYLTTVGVKIDKKNVTVGDISSDLLIWDIAGGSDSRGMIGTYSRGSHGFLYVIDGTRPSTIDFVEETIKKNDDAKPSILLINKADLKDAWQLTEADYKRIKDWNIPILETSAKTGNNVENSFSDLTKRMVGLHA